MGTSKKDYVTCTVRQEGDYDPDMDLIAEDRPIHALPSSMDLQRSRKQPWNYLMECRAVGDLVVGVLGKILAIAAGNACSHMFSNISDINLSLNSTLCSLISA